MKKLTIDLELGKDSVIATITDDTSRVYITETNHGKLIERLNKSIIEKLYPKAV